jgi:hypothetical protein
MMNSSTRRARGRHGLLIVLGLSALPLGGALSWALAKPPSSPSRVVVTTDADSQPTPASRDRSQVVVGRGRAGAYVYPEHTANSDSTELSEHDPGQPVAEVWLKPPEDTHEIIDQINATGLLIPDPPDPPGPPPDNLVPPNETGPLVDR